MRNKILNYVKQPHILFIILALLFGTAFVRSIPPMWGNDENGHIFRAMQVGDGDFKPVKLSSGVFGNKVPENVAQLDFTRGDDNAAIKFDQPAYLRKDLQNPQKYDRLLSQRPAEERIDVWFPGSAAYSPVAYTMPSLAYALVKPFNPTIGVTITIMRFASLVGFITLVSGALWLLRDRKIQWLVLVVALLPTSVFMASFVSADNTAIGLSIMIFALLYRCFSDKKVRPVILAALATSVTALALVKVNYAVLSLGLLLVPARHFSTASRAWAYRLGSLAVAAIATFIWVSLTKDVAPQIQLAWPRPNINYQDQLHFVLTHPVQYFIILIKTWLMEDQNGILRNMVGALGQRGYPLPMLFPLMSFGALTLAALYARDELKAQQQKFLVMGVAGLAGVVGVFTTLYLTYSPVGQWMIDGVQGRYFLPLLLFIVSAIAILLPIKATLSTRKLRIIIVAAIILPLLMGVYWYNLIVR